MLVFLIRFTIKVSYSEKAHKMWWNLQILLEITYLAASIKVWRFHLIFMAFDSQNTCRRFCDLCWFQLQKLLVLSPIIAKWDLWFQFTLNDKTKFEKWCQNSSRIILFCVPVHHFMPHFRMPHFFGGQQSQGLRDGRSQFQGNTADKATKEPVATGNLNQN